MEASLKAHLSLLGNWGLTANDLPLRVAPNGQRLLAFLALKGRAARPYVSGTLWPDATEELADKRLRTTIWRLPGRGTQLLVREAQQLALAPGITVDVNNTKAVAHALIDGNCFDAGVNATAVVSTPELLLGWYEDWVMLDREMLSQLHLQALECLVDRLLEAGNTNKALQVALAAVQVDAFRESAHRAVMRSHLAAGNPGLARRQYQRYQALLHDEFGPQEPSKQMHEVLALV